jgi:MFS family permease
MELNISNTRKWLAFIALALSSMCTLGDMVINPIAAALYDVFAGQSEALINFGITGPALVGLPFGILAGVLCDRMDKKLVMVVGFAIFVVSACFGGVDNLPLFVTLRCFATGVGWGITNTAALSILAVMYKDEAEHGKFVGWYNMVMSVMGAIMAFVAGILAVDGWTHAFWVYYISVPVLIMLIVFLPSMKPVAKTANDDDSDTEAETVEAGWWKPLIPLTIQVFFAALGFFVSLYMVGLYVTGAGIGDEAFIGTLSSISTIATAITSVVFGTLYAKFKNAVYLPGLFIMGACYLVMSFFPSQACAVICIALLGLLWPTYFCYFYTRCTELVPASKAGTATSIVALSDGLAATLCSYLLTFCMSITGSAVSAWAIPGIIMIVTGVVSLVVFMGKRAKKD